MSADQSPALSAAQLRLLCAAASNAEHKPDRHGRGAVLVGRGQGVAARLLEERGLGVVQPDKYATTFIVNDAGLQAVRDER